MEYLKDPLEEANLYFTSGMPLPVDLYFKLTSEGYIPEELEDSFNQTNHTSRHNCEDYHGN